MRYSLIHVDRNWLPEAEFALRKVSRKNILGEQITIFGLRDGDFLSSMDSA